MGTPWPDPWVTIGHLAGVTERLRFLTTVYILPARTPVHVAKQVGTAAVLSGNRVGLGIGMGWMEEEFDAMGVPVRQAGQAGRRDARGARASSGPARWWSTTASSSTSRRSRCSRRRREPVPRLRRRHVRGGPAARRPPRRLGQRPAHHRGAGGHPAADRALPRGVRPHRTCRSRCSAPPGTRGTSTATAACTRPASPTSSRCPGTSTPAPTPTWPGKVDGIKRFADDVIAKW